MKIDIKHYFDTIHHDILFSLLQRKIKDRRLLGLFARIFSTYNIAAGIGLPIGNLISQHCANFCLGSFDHWIKEERLIAGYARYMDDCLLFANSREKLRDELRALRVYLSDRLKLTIKDSVQLQQCRQGLEFLGYRIFPHKILLGRRARKRFVKRLAEYENEWCRGRWNCRELVAHTEPLVAFTMRADARGFRQRVLGGRSCRKQDVIERG